VPSANLIRVVLQTLRLIHKDPPELPVLILISGHSGADSKTSPNQLIEPV
jgi:hypothetical protein